MGTQSIRPIITDPKLRDAVIRIAELVRTHSGRALLVGGCVRDTVLVLPAKDMDIEVYGVTPDRLLATLGESFPLDLVGASFGVIKIKGLPIDVAIPRRESKSGLGHKGFEIQSDPQMTVEDAASRRDFTINAMAHDPLTNELIDPFGGLRDIKKKIIRHTSSKFSEDPLRVLRAMQFAARFDFDVAPETIALCAKLETEGLAAERVIEEWKKLVVQGQRPSKGLQFLRDSGWIRYYPELQSLIGCEQDPQWHPEGDVWTHTLHVMDAFAEERIGDEWEDLVVGLACLCHDFGKPATSEIINGRICSHGHEEAGEAPTRTFLERMTRQIDLIEQIVPLVREHLKPTTLFKSRAGLSAVRRLALRVGRIDRLVRVVRADKKGRPPLQFDGCPACEWIMDQAEQQAVVSSTPQPIIMGRHLIKLGMRPGEHFGHILHLCFEAQLDGHITDEQSGIQHVKALIDNGTVKMPSEASD